MKVVLLPLDERPCNMRFPKLLFSEEDFRVICPENLGDKKKPADFCMVEEFLLRECPSADALVLSVDTLLYGGLIPSRLHHLSEKEVEGRLDLLRRIKQGNASLKIYAFQCIMRCPSYSSNDEEPDYYGICGKEIHQLGQMIHSEILKQGKGEEKKEELSAKIPPEALADYTGRREFNLQFNIRCLNLVQEGIIELLVIPQDDSAPYGYTAMDQEKVRRAVREKKLWDRVLIYPGADELGLTLLARVMNLSRKRTPKVYVKYASVHAPFLVPAYEDRALSETLKYHLMAAGCMQTETPEKADFVLALSAGVGRMLEAAEQPANNRDYDVERNLTEFVNAVQGYAQSGLPVAIGDNAYANGSDLELIAMLDARKLLFKLAGYAGWNTSANTIGTSVAMGVKYLFYGDHFSHRQFMLLRYLEDAGYCAVVRSHITETFLPGLGLSYFDLYGKKDVVEEKVKEELEDFARRTLSSVFSRICIEDVKMPWNRMFEADIRASLLPFSKER